MLITILHDLHITGTHTFLFTRSRPLESLALNGDCTREDLGSEARILNIILCLNIWSVPLVEEHGGMSVGRGLL